MTPKTILYPLGMDQPLDELRPAIELCRAREAHLTVLLIALAPPPPIAVDTVILSDAWASQAEEIKKELHAHGERARDLIAESGISCEIKRSLMVDSSIELAVAEHAFFADLTLISRTLPEKAGFADHVASGVLFGAGKPVLVGAPAQFETLDWKTVLIAWDNEKPAVRAIAEALPILRAAEAVHILSIDPDASRTGDGEAPGWDLAAYLSRHGVNLTVHTQPSGQLALSRVIVEFADDIGADGIVMGAFGHSRLRQRLLGGTTRSMMEDCPLPVLMAH